MKLYVCEIETPVGAVRVVRGEAGVCALDFSDRWNETRRRLERRFGAVEFERVARIPGVTDRINAYLRGATDALETVSVDPGGTPFQRKVWSALRKIPVGRTVSYSSIARRVGRPTGARAVATANAANPISIVVPCHRVIGSDGSLRGYAGGVERKRWLLEHEGARLRPDVVPGSKRPSS